MEKERGKDYQLTIVEKLMFRSRYYADNGIIDTKGFAARYYKQFKDYFNTNREIKTKKIKGFGGIYLLKNLS